MAEARERLVPSGSLVACFVLILAMLGFPSTAVAKGAEPTTDAADDDVVEVVEDGEDARPSRPTHKVDSEPDKAGKIELRAFARVMVTGGLAAARVTPAGAAPNERVGYERGAVEQHAFADLRYSRGKAFQAVVSGSIAYGAGLVEKGANDEGSTLQSGRFEPVLREAFIGIYGEHVDLRLGQQRIVWGNSDGIAPNDVLNARDVRNRMQLDTEMIDMPTLAARADVDLGIATLGLVGQPFFTPDRMSLYGGNWSLVQADAPRSYRRLIGIYSNGSDRPDVDDVQSGLGSSRGPKGLLDGASVGASLRFHTGKIDTSWYYHWGLDRSPFIYLDPQLAAQLEAADPNALNGAVLDGLIQQQKRASANYGGPLVVQYYRRHHVGADIATTVGPFVLRADAAYDSGQTFFSQRTLNSVARPTAQGVFGIEYQTGDLYKMIAFEAWYMRLLGPEIPLVPVLDQANSGPLLFADENNLGFSNLVRWSFLENVVVEVRSFLGVQPSWYMVRPEIGYQTPSFTVRAGVLLIDGESGSYGGYYRRNDTAYLTARHSF